MPPWSWQQRILIFTVSGPRRIRPQPMCCSSLIIRQTGRGPSELNRGLVHQVCRPSRGYCATLPLTLSTSACSCTRKRLTGSRPAAGGYIRAAIRPMDAVTRELYALQLEGLDLQIDSGVAGNSALALAESFLYMNGGVTVAGKGRAKADYSGNLSAAPTDVSVWALPGNAMAHREAPRYQSPLQDGGCGRNHIIYISFGPNPDGARATQQAESLLASVGGDTTPIAISPNTHAANAGDEWSRFMARSRLRIATHTIDIDPRQDEQGMAWTALLRSIAESSGGRYFKAAANADSITNRTPQHPGPGCRQGFLPRFGCVAGECWNPRYLSQPCLHRPVQARPTRGAALAWQSQTDEAGYGWQFQ